MRPFHLRRRIRHHRESPKKSPLPVSGKGAVREDRVCEATALFEDREVREEADAVAVAGADTDVQGRSSRSGSCLRPSAPSLSCWPALRSASACGGGLLGLASSASASAAAAFGLLVLLLYAALGWRQPAAAPPAAFRFCSASHAASFGAADIEQRGMLLGGQIARGGLAAVGLPGGDGGAALGAEHAVGAAGVVAEERQRQLHAAAALLGQADAALDLFGGRHGGIGRRQARDLLARARRCRPASPSTRRCACGPAGRRCRSDTGRDRPGTGPGCCCSGSTARTRLPCRPPASRRRRGRRSECGRRPVSVGGDGDGGREIERAGQRRMSHGRCLFSRGASARRCGPRSSCRRCSGPACPYGRAGRP